ncbi:hypothetical protein ITJ44_05415 [Clavibacter sp. VKM Ac-2873]|uniref:hypothetical protein n=1 Tax=Clavibacter sp. VKM Ac-2873 TaxID=2783813 RepID=UPI00188BE4CE|nr:hypothetical protein [Clavibacter sp. VKM Ac-2873]MBF4617508.1 hypothetical protein [Clavibacter sp. VKM Ac-2873]
MSAFQNGSIMVESEGQMMSNRKRDAEVQYGDFHGTAAADRADAGLPGIHKAVGLDSDRWWILAVDIYAAEKGDLEDHCVSVSAVDRSDTGIQSDADLRHYASENGSVPVTEFQVHGKSAVEISREAFKRLAVQLRVRDIDLSELDVVDQSYVGPPEWL